MRDETTSNAKTADVTCKLFSLREAADHLGLSTPVLRFYLHKYAGTLGIPPIGSGEPLLTADHLTRIKDVYESGIHRSSPLRESAGISRAPEPPKEGGPKDVAHGRTESSPEGGEEQAAHARPDEANDKVQARLLDMTHEWLEEMDQKLDDRLDKLSQTVDFLAEENRELQVLLSRILAAMTTAPVQAVPERAEASHSARSAPPMVPTVPATQTPPASSAEPTVPFESNAAPAASFPSEAFAKAADWDEDGPLEKTYVDVPRIRRREHDLSVVRREDEAKDWSPAEL